MTNDIFTNTLSLNPFNPFETSSLFDPINSIFNSLNTLTDLNTLNTLIPTSSNLQTQQNGFFGMEGTLFEMEPSSIYQVHILLL
jgi:hypothetical protein